MEEGKRVWKILKKWEKRISILTPHGFEYGEYGKWKPNLLLYPYNNSIKFDRQGSKTALANSFFNLNWEIKCKGFSCGQNYQFQISKNLFSFSSLSLFFF